MHTYTPFTQLQREGKIAVSTGAHSVDQYRRTSNFLVYEPTGVPGVLQTPAYTESVMKTWLEVLGQTDSDLEAALMDRAVRRTMLGSPGKYFWFLFEEQVLYTRVTSGADHQRQLEQIRTAMDLPNVEVEIIPGAASRHMPPSSGFWVFDERVGVFDTPAATVTTDDPDEIRALTRLRSELRKYSVGDQDARKLVDEALNYAGAIA